GNALISSLGNCLPVGELALQICTPVRALMMSAALAAGLLLASCKSEDLALITNEKANRPVPDKLIAEMETKDMDLQSPVLVRIFKQEAELEVWKQNRS